MCRCAVGDLSGKHGQVSIRAHDQESEMRTMVATDSNLPLVGPYTGNPLPVATFPLLNYNIMLNFVCVLSVVLGRSLVLYSNDDDSIIGCGQILPENLSAMTVMLSFPATDSIDHR